jgi:integrase
VRIPARYQKPGVKAVQFFKTKDDAAGFITKLVAGRHNELADMTPQDWDAVQEARKLRASGATPFDTAAKQFLEEKEQDGVAKNTLGDYKYQLGIFQRWFPATPPATLSTEQWEEKLRTVKNPTTRNHHRTNAVVFYRWMIRKKMLKESPIAGIPKAKVKGNPRVYSPEEMALLLKRADAPTRIYLVLGGFCGLRTAESFRVLPQDIDLQLKELYVRPSKKGRDRFVKLEPVAVSWLEKCLADPFWLERERFGFKPVAAMDNRKKLYEAVWSKPGRQLAREWGVSDTLIAKRCRRLNVPRPGVGFWVKVEGGFPADRTPLPPTAPAPKETKIFTGGMRLTLDMVRRGKRNMARQAKKDGLALHFRRNGLRDSYISYHLAAFQNANLTADQVGHTDAQTTFRWYRKLVRKEEALLWWKIKV